MAVLAGSWQLSKHLSWLTARGESHSMIAANGLFVIKPNMFSAQLHRTPSLLGAS